MIDKTSAERQKTFLDRQKRRGMVRLQVWLPEATVKHLDNLRKRGESRADVLCRLFN